MNEDGFEDLLRDPDFQSEITSKKKKKSLSKRRRIKNTNTKEIYS